MSLEGFGNSFNYLNGMFFSQISPRVFLWSPSGFCSNVTLSVKLFFTSLYKYQHPHQCSPYPFSAFYFTTTLIFTAWYTIYFYRFSQQGLSFSIISTLHGNCVTQWQQLYSSTNFDGSSMMKFTTYTFLFNSDHTSEKTGNQ